MKARSFGTVVAVTMVASGLLLAACGKSSTGSGSSSTTSVGPKSSDLAASLGAHNWVLDPAHSTVDAPADHPIDLKFPDAHTATGTASCNTYRSTIRITGDTGLRFGSATTTNMACPSPAMVAQQKFLEAIAKVAKADLTDPKHLVLSGGGVRLAFDAITPSAKLSGTWTITSYHTPSALTSPLAGTEPKIKFGDKKKVQVTTGCNNISATWESTGGGVRFSEGVMTMMACETPAGVMDQQKALSQALTNTRTVDVGPKMLKLLDDQGTIMIIAVQD